ncbi:hypothetical protein BJF88_00080 [Cellulosimicrobium sp. CUA-896]|nr:hypothetical protein BJF88_00080 [Cellulosimicrobium sp. CUA-896]
MVRDIFNDDFSSLVVEGDGAWGEISTYVEELAPDLRERVTRWTSEQDVFTVHRVDEQLAKGMDRKVWLPSGGSLVIDRTEAMTVVDVNTGKFTGSGGTLEETVTRNNLEAAEEIVRQLRLRDIGGIIVIDFIDMVLESNRDLVLRRLVECLGRDRTKHQVAEVTSLGLVQMTRKRVGQGLVEAFSETCEHCHGRGFVVHTEPIERSGGGQGNGGGSSEDAGEGRSRSRRKRNGSSSGAAPASGAATDTVTLPHAGSRCCRTSRRRRGRPSRRPSRPSRRPRRTPTSTRVRTPRPARPRVSPCRGSAGTPAAPRRTPSRTRRRDRGRDHGDLAGARGGRRPLSLPARGPGQGRARCTSPRRRAPTGGRRTGRTGRRPHLA